MASDWRLIAVLICVCIRGTFAQSPDSTAKHWQILHLPGIGGERMIDEFMVRGLVSGLESRNIHVNDQIYDWTEDEDGLLALSDQKLHARQSQDVSLLIQKIRRAHPNDFFLLTSHSGGVGIAAWALEQLPPGVVVDEWLMLSGAVSPHFDLSPALMHVHGPAIAFNSILDGVLGTGTRLFGTVDRVDTDSGGRIGYSMPLFGDPIQYVKLMHVPYTSAWLRFGNSGDHIGVMTRAFGKFVLAPTAIDERPTTTLPIAASTTRR